MTNKLSSRDNVRLERIQFIILGLIGFHLLTFWELAALLFISNEQHSAIASSNFIGLLFLVCLAVFMIVAIYCTVLTAYILGSWPILLCLLMLFSVVFASIGLLLLWAQVIKGLESTPGRSPKVPPLRRCLCGGEMVAMKSKNWVVLGWGGAPAGYDINYACSRCSKEALIVDDMQTGFLLLTSVGAFCVFLPCIIWLCLRFTIGVLVIIVVSLLIAVLCGLGARSHIKTRQQHPPVFVAKDAH